MNWFLVILIAGFLGLAPTIFVGAALKEIAPADSSRQDSLDACGQRGLPGQDIGTKEKAAVSKKKNKRPIDFKNWSSALQGENGTIFFFLGSLCPCTDAHKYSIMELMSLAPKKGVKLIAVFPNKGESVELVEHFFKGLGFKMTYVIDSDNQWVKKFGARKTPEAFLSDTKGQVVYSGPIDDSVENLGQVKNAFLKNAVLELAEGKPISVPCAEGSGCWIVRNK